MQRKIVERDPVTGVTRERYVDCGPQKARPHVPHQLRQQSLVHGLHAPVKRGPKGGN